MIFLCMQYGWHKMIQRKTQLLDYLSVEIYICMRNSTDLPRRGIILEPLCGKVLGPEDHSLLDRR